jgi:NodT family efflux transporter outer membrane factor (OMF) lipoprotein
MHFERSSSSPGRPRNRLRLFARVAFFAAVLASLCGCTSMGEWWHNGFKVGPEYCPPAVPVAEDWIDGTDVRVRSEASDNSHWWTVFDDPTLNTLIFNAYGQNLDLRTTGFRVMEARAQRAIAAGNLLPQSQQASADYQRIKTAQRVGRPAAGQYFSAWGTDLNLAWELDFWGRFRRAVEAADADLQASIEDYDDVLVMLLGDVGITYVEIRTLQARLAAVRFNVDAQRGALQIAEARFNEGRSTKLDVFQAQNNLAQTESAIPALELALRRASNRLCILCGTAPRDLEQELGIGPIPVPPVDVAVGMPADLLRRRPDVRRAERELAAQSARIGVATADLYPHIAITGTIGLEANDFTDLFRSEAFAGSIGPSLRWNILNYGRLLNNIRVQDARFQQLATKYQSTVLQANAEVEDALAAFLKSHERAATLTDSVDAAQNAVDMALRQYREGQADFNRVFTLQAALAREQDQLAQVSGDVARSLVEIYRALGGGWQILYPGSEQLHFVTVATIEGPQPVPPTN